MFKQIILTCLIISLIAVPFIEKFDDDRHPYFYGRLYVTSVGINVALYYDASQSVVDRWDSATIFKLGDYDGLNIGDHNGQEFIRLFGVKVGMEGYIQLVNRDRVNIRCVDIFNGHNIKTAITDEDGIVVHGMSDILMYTCRDCPENVRICLWEIM